MLDTFYLNRRIAHDLVMLLDTLDEEAMGGEERGSSPPSSASSPVMVLKELKYLLVADYIDDLLQLVFDTSSSKQPAMRLSVCMMEVLLSYCWNYDYLKEDLLE